jgi:hypothetical protein
VRLQGAGGGQAGLARADDNDISRRCHGLAPSAEIPDLASWHAG